MWVGLCTLVDRGEISTEAAVDVFELTRREVVDQRRQEQRILGEPDKKPL